MSTLEELEAELGPRISDACDAVIPTLSNTNDQQTSITRSRTQHRRPPLWVAAGAVAAAGVFALGAAVVTRYRTAAPHPSATATSDQQQLASRPIITNPDGTPWLPANSPELTALAEAAMPDGFTVLRADFIGDMVNVPDSLASRVIAANSDGAVIDIDVNHKQFRDGDESNPDIYVRTSVGAYGYDLRRGYVDGWPATGPLPGTFNTPPDLDNTVTESFAKSFLAVSEGVSTPTVDISGQGISADVSALRFGVAVAASQFPWLDQRFGGGLDGRWDSNGLQISASSSTPAGVPLLSLRAVRTTQRVADKVVQHSPNLTTATMWVNDWQLLLVARSTGDTVALTPAEARTLFEGWRPVFEYWRPTAPLPDDVCGNPMVVPSGSTGLDLAHHAEVDIAATQQLNALPLANMPAGSVIVFPCTPNFQPPPPTTPPTTVDVIIDADVAPDACNGYTIVAGDTPVTIAAAHGIAVDALAQTNANNPAYQQLRPGNVVYLPCAATPDAVCAKHAIVQADNPANVARTYGTTVNALNAANPGYTRWIVGDVLNIPCSDAVPSVGPTTTLGTCGNHVVAAGESMRSIADTHGVPVAALYNVNGLGEASSLQIGQVLALPCGSPPTTAPGQVDEQTETPESAATARRNQAFTTAVNGAFPAGFTVIHADLARGTATVLNELGEAFDVAIASPDSPNPMHNSGNTLSAQGLRVTVFQTHKHGYEFPILGTKIDPQAVSTSIADALDELGVTTVRPKAPGLPHTGATQRSKALYAALQSFDNTHLGMDTFVGSYGVTVSGRSEKYRLMAHTYPLPDDGQPTFPDRIVRPNVRTAIATQAIPGWQTVFTVIATDGAEPLTDTQLNAVLSDFERMSG